jgi:hypothetical protein
MVWIHQLSCYESSILLSVFNLHLFPSSSSMPRPLAYRHSLPLSSRYCMVVLKTCNEFMFFIFVIPSEIRRFKFTVSWLCDDHIAAHSLRRKRSSTSRYDSHLSVLSKDYSLQRLTLYWLPPANRLTIRRWGRLSVQGADKRVKCSISHFSPRGGFLCENGAPLFFTCFDYLVLP